MYSTQLEVNKKLATLIPLSVIGKAYQVAFNLVFAHVCESYIYAKTTHLKRHKTILAPTLIPES